MAGWDCGWAVLFFFGVGVAAPVFKHLPSKDLAGTLNGIILHRLNIVEHVAGVMLLVGLVLSHFSNLSTRRFHTLIPLLICAMMLALMLFYAHFITPTMETLKMNINSFDTPNAASMPFVEQFRFWHVVYSRLVSANLVFGAVVFVWQIWLLARLLGDSSSSYQTHIPISHSSEEVH
jgi:hypothetical protein